MLAKSRLQRTVRNFDPPVQFIVRSNVTEIRFRILAFDTGIKAVNVINYFE